MEILLHTLVSSVFVALSYSNSFVVSNHNLQYKLSYRRNGLALFREKKHYLRCNHSQVRLVLTF